MLPTLRKVKYSNHDKQRVWLETAKRGDRRFPFEQDRSRIIHSAGFRRLQGKTQVFTVGEGDFFRTCLTHSLEVAQIGKGIALQLKADTDLVEAICLAHDLGHPPFGHAGEDELKALMKSLGGFEANAQNLRILTLLESKSEEYRGLNLTRAVLDGVLKYKEAFSSEKGKFYYEEDQGIVNWATEGAPDNTATSFECQIMDWADEAAYSVHDLEDSLHAKMITTADLRNDRGIISTVHSKVQEKYPDFGTTVDEVAPQWRALGNMINPNLDFEAPTHAKRKSQRKTLTSLLISEFILGVRPKERAGTARLGSHISGRYTYELDVPKELRIRQLLLNQLLWDKVFQSPNVKTLEHKGRNIVRNLFEAYVNGDSPRNLLPDDWKELYDESSGDKRSKARIACDYISGMTDSYAAKIYARLFLPEAGSVYEVL